MNPYISVMSIFLAIVLFYHNWKINRNSIFLSGFIIVIAIYALIHYFLLIGDNVFWLAVLYNNTAPICYLAGPLLYFYVRGTIFDKSKLQKKDWFHFLPATINLVSITPYLLTSFNYKLQLAKLLLTDTMAAKNINVGMYPNVINALARPILLFIYTTICVIMILRFVLRMNKNEYIPKRQSRIVLKWLFFFVGLIVIIVITFMYLTYLFWSLKSPDIMKLNTSYAMYIVSICLSFIPLSLIIYPEILYGIPENKDSVFVKSNIPSETQQTVYVEKETIKLINDSLVKDVEPRFIVLSESIIEYIKEKKIYLNPNFSMEELSRAMNVPKHHLYYCFNSILQIKLTELRSELRIDYAKQLIDDGLLDHFTLDVVGEKAGFSTRSSFQSTFKMIEGCTPGEYRKMKS